MQKNDFEKRYAAFGKAMKNLRKQRHQARINQGKKELCVHEYTSPFWCSNTGSQ